MSKDTLQPDSGKQLSVFDTTCIIAGIIIGAGIYETAPAIADSMGGWIGTLGVWLLGGVLAMAGSLCYAELATAYPQEGGDYVYLSRAYGRWAGYLFGWSQLAIIRPGDIALMAFIFSTYAQKIYWFTHSEIIYAAAVIVILTAINALGVRQGKWTQNLLTVVKALGLLAIVAAGIFAPASPQSMGSGSLTTEGFKLALILVLFTFGGWNEMAYVAAEVRNPRKNILRASVIGIVTVTVLYLLINTAFLNALGYEKMAESEAIAVDTVAAVFPDSAARSVSIIICISTLGAVNGLIFTGARISYKIGSEYTLFRRLGRWNRRSGTPVSAIIAQGVLSLAIVLLAGSFIDTILYTAPVVWLFFLGTAVSVFVLRYKEPDVIRYYKVTGYPVTAILYCICAAFMLYSCISYALNNKPVGLLISVSIVVIGIIFYWFNHTGFSKK